MSAQTTTFSDAITHRSWKRNGKPVESSHYYGRVREPGKPWKWHKLFTDKRASLNHWNELRRQHEHRASGLYREDVERLKKPISQLADEYHKLLEAAGKDADHIRISKWMLERLIELGQLTEDEQRDHPNCGYVAYEEYPESESPMRGRYWTKAQIESGCGTVTTMGQSIAETYARDPKFYGGTFCCGCGKHFPVEEFVWTDGSGERVGS